MSQLIFGKNLNRAILQRLAKTRLSEAKILLGKEKYSGAYYIAGYCIECALKACIAKETKKSSFPDKQAVIKYYTHDLEILLKSANLEVKLIEKSDNDEQFASYWNTVQGWSEHSRYDFIEPTMAIDYVKAVGDTNNGILKWIKLYW